MMRRSHQVFDVNGQKAVQDMLLEYIGFNRDAGCVGETEHRLH